MCPLLSPLAHTPGGMRRSHHLPFPEPLLFFEERTDHQWHSQSFLGSHSSVLWVSFLLGGGGGEYNCTAHLCIYQESSFPISDHLPCSCVPRQCMASESSIPPQINTLTKGYHEGIQVMSTSLEWYLVNINWYKRSVHPIPVSPLFLPPGCSTLQGLILFFYPLFLPFISLPFLSFLFSLKICPGTLSFLSTFSLSLSLYPSHSPCVCSSGSLSASPWFCFFVFVLAFLCVSLSSVILCCPFILLTPQRQAPHPAWKPQCYWQNMGLMLISKCMLKVKPDTSIFNNYEQSPDREPERGGLSPSGKLNLDHLLKCKNTQRDSRTKEP